MAQPDYIGQKVRVNAPNEPAIDGAIGVTIPAYARGHQAFGPWPEGKAVVMIIGGPFVTEHDLTELEVIE